MLLVHAYRLIFLKTVKTAGTSIETSLQKALLPQLPFSTDTDCIVSPHGIVGARGAGAADQPFYNHMKARALREAVGAEVFDAYHKVTSIRNPFDKVVSWFFFSQHERSDFDTDRRAFNALIRSGRRLPEDRRVYTIRGQIRCDRFLRFERLQADVDALMFDLTAGGVAGLALDREKTGLRAAGHDFRDYYDAASRARVTETFAPELERFGYSFDGPA